MGKHPNVQTIRSSTTFFAALMSISNLHCSGKLKTENDTGFKVETPATVNEEEAEKLKKDLATLLQEAVEGNHRSEQAKARDPHRHPVETLSFMGLEPEMTVLEVAPGGEAWYVDILAPVLSERGKLIVTSDDPNGSPKNPLTKDAQQLAAKLAEHPEVFGNVEVQVLNQGEFALGPENSVDLVLTFRNSHLWQQMKIEDKMYQAIFAVLKPGGIFGLEQHRADPNQKSKKYTGYMREADIIQKIEEAGFELVEKSEINANPKDTKDYKKGVWTLPPVFALGNKDRDKYAAIGESDRMTLKFRKPGGQMETSPATQPPPEPVSEQQSPRDLRIHDDDDE